MSVSTRRILYSVLATVAFALIVPFAVKSRLWLAELAEVRNPVDLEPALDPTEWTQPLVLALVGFLLAGAFLYAALSVGHARAWRPQENQLILCRRCGAELGFGIGRCPTCDQHLVW